MLSINPDGQAPPRLDRPFVLRRATGVLPMIAIMLLAIVMVSSIGGCRSRSGGGELEVIAAGAQSGRLPANVRTAVYTTTEGQVASVYVTDIRIDELLEGNVSGGQIINFELLWTPVAGETPLETTATNLAIQHVVLAEDEMGLYGGAGFTWPSGTIGKSTITLSISGASLALIESTEGFVDRISPGLLSGTVRAVHNPVLARKMAIAASQIVTNRLGKPRFIDAGAAEAPAGAMVSR